MPTTEACTRVLSMSASAWAFAANFIPIPTMRAVNSSGAGIRSGDVARLNAMAEPPGEVSDRRTHMRRPQLISVLHLEPRHALGKFRRGRRERDAVGQIGAAITE